MYMWEFCFADLTMVVTNQQNSSNVAMEKAVAAFCDEGTPMAQSWHTLVGTTAWDKALVQSRFALGPGTRRRFATFAQGRLAIATVGLITHYRQGMAGGQLDFHWDHHVCDEMQAQAGDSQMLSSRVKRPAGLTAFLGDSNQVRTPIVKEGHDALPRGRPRRGLPWRSLPSEPGRAGCCLPPGAD